jgi:hypothetical protein
MLGAILTETVLVRWLGVVGTGLTALALNLAAALFALRLAPLEQGLQLVSPAERPAVFTARTYRYLVVGLLSGAVMLALEVIWFRFLLLTYTGTALTFAVMLAVVLGVSASVGSLPAASHSAMSTRIVGCRTSLRRAAHSSCSPTTGSTCSPHAKCTMARRCPCSSRSRSS